MLSSRTKNTIKVFDGKYSAFEKFLLCLFGFYVVLNLFANSTSGADIINYIRVFRFLIYGIFVLDIIADIIAGKKRVSVYNALVAFAVALIFVFSRQNSVLVLFLFLAEASKFRFRDLSKTFSVALFSGIFIIVLFSLVGVLNNTEFSRGSVLRYGLGFGWTTIGPSSFAAACLGWLYARGKNISFAELLAGVAIAVAFYVFTDSRMAFYITVSVCVAGFIVKTTSFFSRKGADLPEFLDKSAVRIIVSALPVLLFLSFCALVVVYELKLPYAEELNSVLSDRLRLTVRAFNEYGVSPFGKNIEWRGWNQETFFTEGYDYLFVDNAYFKVLFDYGVVGFALMMAGYTTIAYYSFRKKDYFLSFALIVCFLNGVISPSLLNYGSNVFVLSLAPLIFYNKNFIGERKTKPEYAKSAAEKKEDNGIPNLGKSVAAVVVTFNRKKLLRESLCALFSSNYKYLKIIVVDNASTDGTYDYIKDIIQANPDKFSYFNTGANLGGAGGFNFGVKKALEVGVDYIWLMDDDCAVNKTSLYELIKFAYEKNDDFGYLSSKVLWKDGSPCKMNIQRRSFGDKKFNLDKSGQKIRLASFVSLLLNVKAVEEVGLPRKEFFIWGDDWEYTYRLSESFDCYYVAESVVLHNCKENSGVNVASDDKERLGRYFYYYRNEGFLYKKAGLDGLCYYYAKVFWHTLKILFFAKGDKGTRFKSLFKGVAAGWKFDPDTEYAFSKDTEISVLELFGEPISFGGQEAVVKNLYAEFKNENVKYTFCTPFYCDNTEFCEMIESRGDSLIVYNKKFNGKLRKFYQARAARSVLKNSRFDVVHIHAGGLFALSVMAKTAKRAGVKKVIVHAHSEGINRLSYRIMKKFSDRSLNKYADVFLGCSLIAAKWKFPKKVIDDGRYIFIKNGVLTEKFAFDPQVRKTYREKLGVENAPVICQIGRFTIQKNYAFTLRILNELKAVNFNFKMIAVGEGPLKRDFVSEISGIGMSDKIIFLEKRTDVAELLSASDVFILPSLYEGFPVVAVESQAAGLPTICSDKITDEAKITDIAEYVPIENAELWANKIIEKISLSFDRGGYAQKVKNAGFDIKDSAVKLENIYYGYDYE